MNARVSASPSEKRPLQNKKCPQGGGSAHVGNHCPNRIKILCTLLHEYLSVVHFKI